MQYCEFLEKYREFTRGNETPEAMHLWCGLSTLSGACEKRLWIDQSFFNLYFNLYILLLGPAGVVGKSSSLKQVTKMLKEAGFFTLEGAVLKEKIIEDMEAMTKQSNGPFGAFEHSSVTYIANEFNVLLSAGIDMIKFLVDIYDKDDSYIYKTKKSGQYEIPHPYFSMIGAAVPQWFSEYVASDMGATGLLARCIIVYEETKRGRYPKLVYTKEQKKAREKCMEIIYAISQMHGEVIMTEEADHYFSNWYMKQDTSAVSDHRISSYLERKTKVHVLKIAGLMAVGDVRQEITADDIKRAIHMLDSIEPKMRLAYVVSGANKLAPYIHKVITILEERGGSIEMFKLMRMFYQDINIEEVKELVSTVVDMGEARREKDSSGTRWLVKKY